MAGEENVFQLAFIDLGFAAVDLFTNIILGLFQSLLTGVFSSIFGALTGATA